MTMNMRISSLIPAGLVVESLTETEAKIVVLARAAEPKRPCPLCGTRSRRIHSRYRRRRAETTSDQELHRVPSARTIARLMTSARAHLSKAETVTVAAIETGVPMLAEARRIVDDFHVMIRKKDVAQLDTWIAEASPSLIASLAKGVANDKSAIRAAITQP